MLSNKVSIVTGGSGLIGSAILEQIINWNGIAINLDLNPCKIKGAIDYECDISKEFQIKKALKEILSQHEIIHGLINCAYPRTKDWGTHSVENLPISSWKENVDIHLNSYFFLCQQVLNHMKNNRGGSVVNFGSIYGELGNDFSLYDGLDMYPPPAYSAIKGGIINTTRYLAAYYGKYGINVNCVSPGGIFDNQNPTFVQRYEERVPQKRMGTPEDVAPITAFLLTKGATYINGQNIVVDGGWSIV